jgi:RimJ/RimL family protein N-acetyltransferase
VSAGAAIAGAVLSGHTQGRVFVNARGDTRTAFVHDQGFCVLAGVEPDAGFATACLDWLHAHAGQDFFILYPGHPAWVPVLDAAVVAPVQKVQRVGFRFDPADSLARRSRQPLPPGFVLAPMDADLMRQAAAGGYPWLGGTWKSAAAFAQDGVGFCVLEGGRIASLCYSVFVHGRHHEIDILTFSAHRRLGLGRVVATAFIAECLRRSLEPGWDCFQDNLPSHRLAEALGFQPVAVFPVYSWQRGR